MLTLPGVIAATQRKNGRGIGGGAGGDPGPDPELIIWGPMSQFLIDGSYSDGNIDDIHYAGGSSWLAVVRLQYSGTTNLHIVRSANDGVSWSTVLTIPDYGDRRNKLVTDGTGNWFLGRIAYSSALYETFTYVSSTNGATWEKVNMPNAGEVGGRFSFAATNGDGIWLNVAENGWNPPLVKRSTDGGRTWATLSPSPGPGGADTIQFLEASRTGTFILAKPGDSGAPSVYKTVDGGDSWQFLTNYSMRVAATNHIGMWVAATAPNEVLISTDDGDSWVLVPTPDIDAIGEATSIATDENDRWVIGYEDGSAAVSYDNAGTWEMFVQDLNSGGSGNRINSLATNKNGRWMAGFDLGYAAVYPALEAPSVKYLTFTGNSDFTLSTANSQVNWDGILEYSTDKELWVVWDGTEIVSSGHVLYLRGKGNTIITGANQSGGRFVISGASSVSCDGDVMSLLDWEDPEGAVMGIGCFFALFYGCTSLIKAPNMTSTTATNKCYERMFEGCTSLVVPPELPATTVANRSYGDMFAYCSSLITTPSLPALTIDANCYVGMFRGCISLTRPADLPATTLYVNCYSAMFYGCENIRVSQSVGGVPWRIPSVGLIEQDYLSWGADMLTGTGGDFISAPFSSQPDVNTTYYLY